MKPHICHVFPSFVSGGSQVRTCRLMGALGSAYRHSVIGLDGKTSASELVAPGLDWALLEAPKKAGSWTTIKALKRLFQGLSPDLICTYNWGSIDAVIAAAWSGRARALHHEDGFGADEALGPKRRRTWMRRLVLPRTAGVLVPSHTLQRIATERWRLPPERVHHIPIGIRIEDFPLANGNPGLRAQLGLSPSCWVLGSVGHLRPEKNPLRLVEAFGQLPTDAEAHLILLGEGAERAAVEARIRRLGLGQRISLVGYQSSPAAYYQAMDALAISSDTEQMPVNLLEAMAAGLPVASTDVGDVRHMLPQAQADFVVPIDRQDEAASVRALAQALERLLRDRRAARALGQENHAHLRKTYSFEGMCQSFQGHYDRALASARG